MPPARRKCGKIVSDTGLRRQWATRRRTKGKLAGIDDLPLDILHEILSHLSPHDVLRISRVSKDFRAHLLDPSAKRVWKAAWLNAAGLPDPLPGLSEPAFIELVYEKTCAYCSRTTTKQVEWSLRTRLCASCEKQHVNVLAQWSAFGNTRVGGVLLGLQPGEEKYPGIHATCDTNEPFIGMIPYAIDLTDRVHFLLKDLIDVKKAYYALATPEERHEFVARKTQESLALVEAGKAMKEWADEQQYMREKALHEAREDRRREIVRRLTEAGWGYELAQIKMPHSLSELDVVRKPQRMTNRIWKNVEPVLVEFMERMRNLRHKHEVTNERYELAIEYLRNYKLRHPKHLATIPGPADFCLLDIVHSLIHRDIKTEVSSADFQALEANMDRFCTSWYHEVAVALSVALTTQRRPRMLAPNEGLTTDLVLGENTTPMIQRLRLATSLWVCRASDCPLQRYTGACRSRDPNNHSDFSMWRGDNRYACFDEGLGHHRAPPPLAFSAVVCHPCFAREKSYFATALKQRADRWKTLTPWNRTIHGATISWAPFSPYFSDRCTARVEIDLEYCRIAEAIITASGMNKETTTAEDLDDLPCRFACMICPTLAGRNTGTCYVWASGWREMLRHYKARHPGASEPLIWKMDPHVYEKATVVETNLGTPAEWICLHCMDTRREEMCMTTSALFKHFLSHAHSNVSPKEGVDYARSPDTPKRGLLSPVERDTTQLLEIPIADFRDAP